MLPSSQVSLEIQNSLRLAHQALKDKGRKTNDISPLEAFYLNLSQRVLPGSQSRKLLRPGIEAFYSNNLDSEDFIALVHKDLLAVAQGVDVSDVVDVCLDEYLSVGNRREDVERYISVQAAKQLWMTFAKLDTFGRLGLPNAEINELLIRGVCACACVCARARACVRVCSCTCVCACVFVHQCVYVYLPTYVRMHVYVCMYVCMYVLSMYLCMDVCMHVQWFRFFAYFC